MSRSKLSLFFAFVLIFALSAAANAAFLQVPSTYGTIQDAVNAANPYDVIAIDAAAYNALTLNETVTVDVSNLNIGSSGMADVGKFILQAGTVTIDDASINVPVIDVETGGLIQDAVNGIASPGGTVNVAAGTYAEDVTINKDITISGTGSPTVNSFVFNITPINISGILVSNIDVNSGGTIQDAIDVIQAGGTIDVFDGTYAEDLSINKSVTIQKGSGATAVTIQGVHQITANTITLDGFSLTPGAGVSGTVVTINSSASAIDGISITNCTFNMDTSPSVGVYLGGGTPTNPLTNITIDSNIFNGPNDKISNPWKIGGSFGSPLSCEVNGFDFINNTVNYGSIPINLQDSNLTDIYINNNTFSNTDGALYIWGEDGTNPTGVLSQFVFTNNTIDDTNTYGIGIDNDGTGFAGPVFSDANFGSGNMIQENTFGTLPGNYGYQDVSVLSNLSTYEFDASQNWWGDLDPTDDVDGSVDYIPYYDSDAKTNLVPYVSNPLDTLELIENFSDEDVNLTPVFADDDGIFASYSVINNTNSGVVTTTIVSATLTLSSVADQYGTAKITVQATDNNGATTTDTLTVEVAENQDPVVDNPIADIMDWNFAEFGSSDSKTIYVVDFGNPANNVFSDPEDETLSYSAISNDPSIVSVDTGMLPPIITLTRQAVGTTTIEVTAEDPRGGTTVDTFTVEVTNSIQSLIDNANPGDVITVADGTYEEDLTIPDTKTNIEITPNSAATIKGVANVDAANFPLAAPNIEILADGVKIYGFTIESPDYVAAKYTSGMVIGAQNVEIYNNAFIINSASTTDEISQVIQTYADGAIPGVDISGLNIHDNTFTHKNAAGTWGYEAIYVNKDAGTGAITIQNNVLSGELFRGITVERSEATISGNDFITDLAPCADDLSTAGAYQGVNIRNLNDMAQSNITISGNNIKGSGSGLGFNQGLRIGHSDAQTLTNVSATNDTLMYNKYNVIVKSASGVSVNESSITEHTMYAAQNDDAANTLDIERNWWGTADGTTIETYMSGDVDYLPWYTDAGFTNLVPEDITMDSQTIDENQAAGTVVGNFSTTDNLNPGADNYTYTFAGGTDDASFTIDGTALKAAAMFDHETKATYNIKIQTNDNYGGVYTEDIVITVNDVNEDPTDMTLSNSAIDENLPALTIVGTFTTTDEDDGDTHTYSLVGGDTGSFTIVDDTLKTNAEFDYETKSSYSIDVQTEDSGSKTYQETFTITVNDVNDAPTAVNISSDNVNEEKPVGTVVGDLTTDDDDAGDTHIYSLAAGVADNDSFQVDNTTKKLKTAVVFDYESNPGPYTVEIQTDDQNGGTYTETLTININPVNEAPTEVYLAGNTLTVYMDENQGAGASAGTFTTDDPEPGDSHTYSFVPSATEYDNGNFTINTDELVTAIDLDYEDQPTHTIKVRSTDDGTPAKYLEKFFIVLVNDVNDAPTGISMSDTTVAEEQPVGTAVGTFSSEDQDVSDTHTYTLVAGTGDTDNNKFAIVGDELQTDAVLDFETQETYSIRVQTDDGNGGMYEEVLTIVAIDGNDPPTDISMDSQEVYEEQVVGTLVGTFSTTEANDDPSDTHTYMFVETGTYPDNASFTIDGDQLKTAEVFDFETDNSYQIKVRSTDDGGLYYEELFTITIVDTNEAPTDINLSSQSVVEEQAVGTVVGDLTTVDENVGDDHTYTFVENVTYPDNSKFTLDNTNDQLKTNEVFDFETQDTYTVKIQTQDDVGATYAEVFTITIVDGNDPPTDLAIDDNTISENAPIGTKVGQFTTTEGNDDPSDTHTYSLEDDASYPDNTSFTIVDDSLTTAVNLDYDTQNQYTILVRTTDNGGLYYEEEVIIDVTEYNEAPTAISISSDNVDELQPVGTLVGTFTTTDADLPGDTHTYTFDDGADDAQFTIQGDSLLTAAEFDYETDNSYTIKVKSTDGGGLSISETFIITVNDINDPPVVTPATVAIDENSTGTVHTVVATDQDGTVASYDIIGGNTDNAFAIDNSGVITVSNASAVNYEVNPTFSLVVEAEDNIGATGSDTITVNLNDVDEAPTDIVLSNQSVEENKPIGTLVDTLFAVDEDMGDTYIYELVAGTGDDDNGSFTIYGDSLLTAESFNYENKDSYSIRVKVIDGIMSGAPIGGRAVPEHTFEKQFTISITDVNDAPTGIALSDTTVEENGPPNTPVGTFTTMDEDAGDSHTYSLTNDGMYPDNQHFTISGDTLKTNSTFDFENTDSLEIYVQTDDGNGGTYDREFVIKVLNVNDAPTISDIADTDVDEDTEMSVNFIVKDADNDDASLMVSGASSDTTLVPNGNISFATVDDTTRTLTIMPAQDQNGSATITVTVSDGDLDASDTFVLAVNPVNDAPTISEIADQTTDEDETLNVPFTVGDVETPVADLTLTATSDNQTLVPDDSLEIVDPATRSTENRTLVIKPALNEYGTANITITASDGALDSMYTFELTVDSVNDLPMWTAIDPLTFEEDDNTQTVDLTAYVDDVEDADADLTWGTPIVQDVTVTSGISQSRDKMTSAARGKSTSSSRKVDTVRAGNREDELMVEVDADGIAHFYPAENWYGSKEVIFPVTDTDGGSSNSDPMLVTVTPVNDVPEITSGTEDWNVTIEKSGGTYTTYSRTVVVFDPDNNIDFTTQWIGSDGINGFGTVDNGNMLDITIAPMGEDWGHHQLEITATEASGAYEEVMDTLDIYVLPMMAELKDWRDTKGWQNAIVVNSNEAATANFHRKELAGGTVKDISFWAEGFEDIQFVNGGAEITFDPATVNFLEPFGQLNVTVNIPAIQTVSEITTYHGKFYMQATKYSGGEMTWVDTLETAITVVPPDMDIEEEYEMTDFNGDGIVGGIDVNFFSYHYGSQVGDQHYDEDFDIGKSASEGGLYELGTDGYINFADLWFLSVYFGQGAYLRGNSISRNIVTPTVRGGSSANASLAVEFGNAEYTDDGTVELDIIGNCYELHGTEFEIIYDSEKSELMSVSQGEILTAANRTAFFHYDDNAEEGIVKVTYMGMGSDFVISDSGILATLEFKLNDDMEVSFGEALVASNRNEKTSDVKKGDSYMILWDDQGNDFDVPTAYNLSQNFPNPFNPTTTIKYDLPKTSHVTLKIYDASGKLIRTLVDATAKEAGYHSVMWNGTDDAGRDVSSGVYFYRIVSEDYSKTCRMLLLK